MPQSISQLPGAPINKQVDPAGKSLNVIPRKYFRSISLKMGSALAIWLGTLLITRYGYNQASLVTLMAYATFFLAGFAVVWRSGATSIRIFATVYGTATVATVALAWIFTNAYGVPYWNGGSDELHYEEAGIEFAQRFGLFDYGAIREGIVQEWHNSVGYIYLMGLQVKFSELFGGFHTMVPRLLNAACLALLSVMVFNIGLRLRLQKRIAIAAALFSGCLPLMMWVSVQTLRDIIQTLLLVTLVYLWVPDHKNRWRYSVPVLILLSVLLLLPIWELRKPQAFVALAIMAFAIVSNRSSYKPMQLVLLTLPIAMACAHLISLFYAVLNKDVLDFIDATESYAELRGTGGTGGGLSSIVFETPLFPIGWLYRTTYALISPLPVEFLPIDKAWLSLGTVIHLLFLPFMWMGLKRAFWHQAWRLIAGAFVLLFIGMAMFTFSSRHITQYLPFAILLAALGYENYLGDHRRVWLAMGALGAAMGVTYVVLKGL